MPARTDLPIIPSRTSIRLDGADHLIIEHRKPIPDEQMDWIEAHARLLYEACTSYAVARIEMGPYMNLTSGEEIDRGAKPPPPADASNVRPSPWQRLHAWFRNLGSVIAE